LFGTLSAFRWARDIFRSSAERNPFSRSFDMASESSASATGVVAILAIFIIAAALLVFVFFRAGGSWFGGMPNQVDVDIPEKIDINVGNGR
jgi:hypothetical protein